MMPNPVRVSTVESVTFHEEEQDVYDLTIPGPHTYVVEGLMSHNTAVGSTQMLLNMSLHENVALVALEMDEYEMTARILSNLGGVKVHKFGAKTLTDKEKAACKREYKKAVEERKKLGTRYTIYSPDVDITMEEALYGLLPFGYRVFLIDYISLLKGVDGDDAWQALGRVARFAKVFARINNVAVVLLAQLNDEGKIRYAKSIIEHCLTGDTWIDTPDGMMQIGTMSPDLDRKQAEFPMFRQVLVDGKQTSTTAWHKHKVKPVYEVTTERGYSNKATSRHKFLVLKPNMTLEYVRVNKLKQGDLLTINIGGEFPTKQAVIPRIEIEQHHNHKQDVTFPRKVNAELAYTLGALMADGYIGTNGSVEVVSSKSQAEFARNVVDCANFAFKTSSWFLYEPKTNTRVIRAMCNRTQIREWLSKFDGMSGGSAGKYIPESIMRSPKKVAAAFLRGAFDGDGTVSGNCVVFNTISHECAKRMQILLRKFGVVSTLRVAYTGNTTQSTMYAISISGRDVQTYAKEIAFTVVSKRNKLGALCHKQCTRSYTDFIPGLTEYVWDTFSSEKPALVRTFFNSIGNQQPYAYKGTRYYQPINASKITRSVKEILNQLEPGLGDRIADIVSRKSVWIPLKSVTSAGREHVYDLTTDTHSFCANGVHVHNSNVAWFWTYTEQSRESGILDILPVKARNQDPAPIQLWHDFSVMRARDTAPDEYEKALNDKEFQRNRKDQQEYVGEAVRQAKKGSTGGNYRYSMEDEIPV
jgi:intein/homing endonuclease